MTKHEYEVLRYLNGEKAEGVSWGAALNASIEFLQEDGYVTYGQNYKLTKAGFKALEEYEEGTGEA